LKGKMNENSNETEKGYHRLIYRGINEFKMGYEATAKLMKHYKLDRLRISVVFCIAEGVS
jgi:hypothetical protein